MHWHHRLYQEQRPHDIARLHQFHQLRRPVLAASHGVQICVQIVLYLCRPVTKFYKFFLVSQFSCDNDVYIYMFFLNNAQCNQFDYVGLCVVCMWLTQLIMSVICAHIVDLIGDSFAILLLPLFHTLAMFVCHCMPGQPIWDNVGHVTVAWCCMRRT